MSVRAGYDDVVLAAPVTVPYARHSIRGAHWFLARVMAAATTFAGGAAFLAAGSAFVFSGITRPRGRISAGTRASSFSFH